MRSPRANRVSAAPVYVPTLLIAVLNAQVIIIFCFKEIGFIAHFHSCRVCHDALIYIITSSFRNECTTGVSVSFGQCNHKYRHSQSVIN